MALALGGILCLLLLPAASPPPAGVPVASGKTDSTGKYSITFSPTSTGSYQVSTGKVAQIENSTLNPATTPTPPAPTTTPAPRPPTASAQRPHAHRRVRPQSGPPAPWSRDG